MRMKGVSAETIDEVVDDLDDQSSAYRAGTKKARALRTLDYSDFREKLGAFLQRRGFSYDIIGTIVERLWGEREEADEGSET